MIHLRSGAGTNVYPSEVKLRLGPYLTVYMLNTFCMGEGLKNENNLREFEKLYV